MVHCNAERVTFRIRNSDAVRVFLVGDFDRETAQVFGMDSVEPGVWQTHVDLPPGEYRFCYYHYDGRTIHYQSPPEALAMADGAKAVLRVGA